MDELEQIISCPNCHGIGWAGTFTNSRRSQCSVCEARGRLVIDGDKTLALPMLEKPITSSHS